MKNIYELILRDFRLKDEDIINVYPFGSQIYKTATYKSDHDFIVIVNNNVTDKDLREKSANKLNINIFNEGRFLEKLQDHKMAILECISLPPELMLKNSKQFNFKLNSSKLLEYVTIKCDDDWNRAYKACIEGNIYSAQKSIFHVIRSLDFGIQIMNNGKITDYSSMNDIWFDLKDFYSFDWKPYEEYFGGIYIDLLRDIMKIYRSKER